MKDRSLGGLTEMLFRENIPYGQELKKKKITFEMDFNPESSYMNSLKLEQYAYSWWSTDEYWMNIDFCSLNYF